MKRASSGLCAHGANIARVGQQLSCLSFVPEAWELGLCPDVDKQIMCDWTIKHTQLTDRRLVQSLLPRIVIVPQLQRQQVHLKVCICE